MAPSKKTAFNNPVNVPGLLVFLLLLITAPAFAQVTIENLLSVPFPSELHRSPDGTFAVWVFNDKGVRNIELYNSATNKTQAVTNFKADDGLEITNISITSDNRKIIFIRGNDKNPSGEPANPAHLQNSTAQTLYVVDVKTGIIKEIGTGTQPVISPNGKRIVYVDASQIWTCAIDSVKPHQLFKSRGRAGNLTWSPDGSKLAYVSYRNDHSFVCIYDFTTHQFSFVDPKADYDDNIAWSPDGKYLAYTHVPAAETVYPFVPHRAGLPWSIKLYELGTGNIKSIWTADEGIGSVLVDDIPDSDTKLWFAADGNIVFPWEKESWVHLYSVNISSGKVTPLTPGEGEVEKVVLSADKKSMIYSANIGDINHRHVFKVDVATGVNTAITKGAGVEYGPVDLKNSIVALRSTSQRPMWPALISANGTITDLASEQFPATFPTGLVTPQVVTFTATDGFKTPAQIFLPPNYKPSQKYPAVVFFHGGSRRQMLPAYSYMFYYSNAYSMHQYFASKGYIVLSVNYRSGIGYGLNFREADNYGANGASEVNDVTGAGSYLQSRDDIDTKHIAIWGGSYGGYLTAFGLAKASDVFSCGVDIHGVHDWNEEMKNWVTTYQPEKAEAFAKLARKSSPVAYVDGWKSPVLFIHGDDDRNVPFEETVNLTPLLRARKVHFEELILPDEIHDFLLHSSWIKVYHATFNFIDKHVSK
jgi:dipeptidyl aminopeptidase/acylaminoacyl peptidase